MDGLLEKISQLEKISRELEPDHQRRIDIRNKVMSITDNFLNDLEGMPAYVAPGNYSLDGLKGDFDSVSEEDSVFEEIKQCVDIPGINPAAGNHLGYIPGGGLYTSALGDYWADVTNRYSGVYFADPGAVKIENELIRWMIQMVDYPNDSWGNLASGGSIANLTAIVCAREAHSITPEKISRSVIYLTGQTHHCVNKALKIAGLHHAILRKVPMDPHLRMDSSELKDMVATDIDQGNIPFLVVSSAGTTDSGIIDPIEEIDEIAKKHSIWHHVDAAYGGFFLLTDTCSEKLKAMNLADSLVMDPHKSLFLPYGNGVVLVKDRKHLFNAFSYEANYMQDAMEDEEEISPAEVSPELTKHFRGLRMWLPLKLHGIAPFKACLEEKHYLARYFHDSIIKIEGFEVYQEPELSVVMFRYNKPGLDLNKFNRELVHEIHQDGRVFLSSTTLNGKFWLRVAVLIFRTHKENIDLTLQILKEKIRKIEENF
jgi:glutamate/tyrosine decarboxylase-like PLP-dependent enzyme